MSFTNEWRSGAAMVNACIIDIDATITYDRQKSQIGPDYILNNAIFDVIAEFMNERGWNPETAREALVAHTKTNVYWDYPDFLDALNLPAEEAWKRIEVWHEENIGAFADAVSMVTRLHSAGVPLFIMSNNPVTGCLLKLRQAGLAGPKGSRFFRDIMGTNICMGGKWAVDSWRRCLLRTGFPPSKLAMIGDNLKEDCEIPRSLGVQTIFLVDRRRSAKLEITPEAFLVNSLEMVPDILLGSADSMVTCPGVSAA